MPITRHEPEGGILSNAVEANGFVFLAGSVADDLSLDVAGQTRQALEFIDKMLAKCGTSKGKLVSAQIWLADMRSFPEFNGAWKEWIDPRALPARATVEAKLWDPRCLVEIMVTAAK
jgi:enamine deaminase RidA (YjgF/YER057c/UK114 family)